MFDKSRCTQSDWCQYETFSIILLSVVTIFCVCRNQFCPVDGAILLLSSHIHPFSGFLRRTLHSQNLHWFLLLLVYFVSNTARSLSKHVLCSFLLPRNPSAQRLILPVALDAKQRAKWAFLRPREPEKQRAQWGDGIVCDERSMNWKRNNVLLKDTWIVT